MIRSNSPEWAAFRRRQAASLREIEVDEGTPDHVRRQAAVEAARADADASAIESAQLAEKPPQRPPEAAVPEPVRPVRPSRPKPAAKPKRKPKAKR